MPGAVFLLFVLGLFINPLLKLIQSRAAKIRTDQFRLRQHSCRQIGLVHKNATQRSTQPMRAAPLYTAQIGTVQQCTA